MNGEFLDKEKRDIVVATAVLSLAFGLGFAGRLGLFVGFVLSFFVVGIAFILHELMHRTAARHYGAHAEFRASPQGLMLALITAFISGGGFVFAVPGAVEIEAKKHARWHKQETSLRLEEIGIISFVGPATNIALALLFLWINSYGHNAVLVLAANVNAFLALFNLIPMHPLDGGKIYLWDRKLWAIAFITALVAWL